MDTVKPPAGRPVYLRGMPASYWTEATTRNHHPDGEDVRSIDHEQSGVSTEPEGPTAGRTTHEDAVVHEPVGRSTAVEAPGARAGSTDRSFGRIDDVHSLREHLQCAVELEHATLPPYLCALYSLDRNRNPVAFEVLLSVFVEEMLHLTLAANLLNAVGGRPRLDAPRMLEGHPRPLPHGDPTLEISLLPFGIDALRQFARIERPAPIGARAQGDRYETISQFYDAIRQGLIALCERSGETTIFRGHPARQVTDAFSYGGSGRVIAVEGLTSALTALDEIVEQGEGASPADVWDHDRDMFHPERAEVGHYYRIHELVTGRRYQAGDTPATGPTGEPIAMDWEGVRPMRPDQRVDDQPPGAPIRQRQEAFNAAYCALLAQLDQAFAGHPEMLDEAVGAMYGLKADAEALMQMPIAGGQAVAGPTFEWVPPHQRG